MLGSSENTRDGGFSKMAAAASPTLPVSRADFGTSPSRHGACFRSLNPDELVDVTGGTHQDGQGEVKEVLQFLLACLVWLLSSLVEVLTPKFQESWR